jgi:hypothetical protein
MTPLSLAVHFNSHCSEITPVFDASLSTDTPREAENVRNIIRPDEHPIAAVVADMANREWSFGRYSGGSQRRLTPLWVIQDLSSFNPYPRFIGKENESWIEGLAGAVGIMRPNT